MSLRDEFESVRGKLDSWRSLLSTKEWKELQQVGQEQTKAREQQIIYSPLKDSDSIYEQEFMKGEVAGLNLFFRMAETIIEQLEAEVESLRAKLSTEE